MDRSRLCRGSPRRAKTRFQTAAGSALVGTRRHRAAQAQSGTARKAGGNARHPRRDDRRPRRCQARSEEHTSELQSLMRISYAVFCLKKKKTQQYRADISTVEGKTNSYE